MLNLHAVAGAIVQAAGETGFEPADMGTALAGGAGTILAYVGVGVVAAIPVGFAILGIKRGLSTFRSNAR